jgi:hypothetical protein
LQTRIDWRKITQAITISWPPTLLICRGPTGGGGIVSQPDRLREFLTHLIEVVRGLRSLARRREVLLRHFFDVPHRLGDLHPSKGEFSRRP